MWSMSPCFGMVCDTTFQPRRRSLRSSWAVHCSAVVAIVMEADPESWTTRNVKNHITLASHAPATNPLAQEGRNSVMLVRAIPTMKTTRRRRHEAPMKAFCRSRASWREYRPARSSTRPISMARSFRTSRSVTCLAWQGRHDRGATVVGSCHSSSPSCREKAVGGCGMVRSGPDPRSTGVRNRPRRPWTRGRSSDAPPEPSRSLPALVQLPDLRLRLECHASGRRRRVERGDSRTSVHQGGAR